MTAPLSADQQARLDRIEAAEAAPESIVERVAELIYDRDSFAGDDPWSRVHPVEQDRCRRIAREVVAVLRGPSVADEALRRVEAVAEQYEQHVTACREEGIPYGATLDTLAAAAVDIRAALNGGDR